MVGLALRLYGLRFGYAHVAVDYDSGVYLGSSLHLVDGVLPYRDYTFVHPPGITVLLAPLALLAKVIGTAQAMGIAKILTAVAGAASIPLVGWLVRRRGPVAVGVACGIAALQGDAVATGYSLLLEPWVVLFCLLGVVAVFDGDQLAHGRRLRWGGVLFGIACAMKIWAIVPLLALALILRPVRRRLLTFLGGAIAGFVVPVAPFALLAPGTFVHDVFTVQIFRTASMHTPISQRLIHIFSVGSPTDAVPGSEVPTLLTAALVLLGVLVLAWWRRIARSSPFERFVLVAGVLVVAMLLSPETFYTHYASFSTPFLALAAATPLRSMRVVARRWCVAVLAVFVFCLGFTIVHRDTNRHPHFANQQAVAALIPRGACVVSSMVSATIAQDRFYSDRSDCPSAIDVFGMILDVTDGESPSVETLRDPAVLSFWLKLYEHADYVYLKQRTTPTIPSDWRLEGYLAARFRLLPTGVPGARLYERIRP